METIYENSWVKIYKNPSGEIFIEDKDTGVTARFSPTRNEGLSFTSFGNCVEPILAANSIGWKIAPRHS